MNVRHAVLSVVVILSLGTCGLCADAEKTVVPHASWTCGMPDGIPKPEDGVPVFKAKMTLARHPTASEKFSLSKALRSPARSFKVPSSSEHSISN